MLSNVWQKISANPVPFLSTTVALLGVSYVAIRKYAAGGVCTDVADLTDQVIIITGSNTGIGIETARALAKMKGHIIIACRDEKKGKDAAELIKKETGNQKVENMILDLSSIRSIRKFASDFNSKNLHLNILINNAGVMACPKSKTEDGFEMQFGTNHLGHFLLTNLLLEKLKQSRGRIVNVSSSLHQDPALDLDDLDWEKRNYDKWKAYSASKAANVLFTVELERRLAGTGVQSYALHPGVINTELSRHLGFVGAVFRVFIGIFGKTVVQGSQTTIFAAISPKLEGKGGSYLSDCAIVPAAPHATNPEKAKKLWEISEKLVGFTSP